MDGLLSWSLHRSDRYIVTGNIGFRVVITDLREDKSYVIEYNDLIKFRKHWDNINDKNKDIFLTAIIVHKNGESIKRAA